MTLGEGKNKVLKLLDEYSSGGTVTTDADIMNKMTDFFDMAQKDICAYIPIIACSTVVLNGAEYTNVPTGFKKYFRVWKDGKRVDGFPVINGQMYTKDVKGTYKIEYVKTPDTIQTTALDSYTFEVSEEAANCLPFYVAAQQLITDLVVDYGALWNMYLFHKQNLDTSLPSSGFGRVRQALF